MSGLLHTTPTELASQIGDRLSPMLRQRIRITPVDAGGGVIPRRGGYNADAKPEGLRVFITNRPYARSATIITTEVVDGALVGRWCTFYDQEGEAELVDLESLAALVVDGITAFEEEHLNPPNPYADD